MLTLVCTKDLPIVPVCDQRSSLLKGHMLVTLVSFWVSRLLCRRCLVLVNQQGTVRQVRVYHELTLGHSVVSSQYKVIFRAIMTS